MTALAGRCDGDVDSASPTRARSDGEACQVLHWADGGAAGQWLWLISPGLAPAQSGPRVTEAPPGGGTVAPDRGQVLGLHHQEALKGGSSLR